MLRTLLIFCCVMIKFIQRDEKFVSVAISIYVTSYLINKVLLHKLGTSKTRLQEDKQSRMWDSMVAVGQDSKLCASFCLMRIKKFLSWRNTFLSNYSSGVFQLVTATFCVSIIDLLTLAISDCCLEEIESMRINVYHYQQDHLNLYLNIYYFFLVNENDNAAELVRTPDLNEHHQKNYHDIHGNFNQQLYSGLITDSVCLLRSFSRESH